MGHRAVDGRREAAEGGGLGLRIPDRAVVVELQLRKEALLVLALSASSAGASLAGLCRSWALSALTACCCHPFVAKDFLV